MIRAERTALSPVARDVLWEHFSNTERLNRQLRLPQVHYTFESRTGGGSVVRGRARFGPVTISYTEEPYRWLRPREWWVQRLPENGPVCAYRVGVRLDETAAGTRVTAWSEAEPRAKHGALLARRIVQSTVNGLLRSCTALHAPLSAAAAPPAPGPVDRPERAPGLAGWRERLERAGITPAQGESLLDFLATAPPEEVVDFRPFALADRWQGSRQEVLCTCLRAVRAGALELHWRLLCPACRGAGPSVETLAALTPDTAHCESCQIRFRPTFDRDVEVCFSVATALRHAAGSATYCIAGPHRSRHVVCQWYLLPGQNDGPPLEGLNGNYRFRSPQVPDSHAVRFPVIAPQALSPELLLTPEGFVSRATVPLVVRLESVGWREDAATAAEVTALAEFRQHFGSEVLSPGMELDVRQVTLLFTDLKDSTRMYAQHGDAPSYATVRGHFRQLAAVCEAHHGSVVKTIGDAVMAAFPDPADAIRAALAIQALNGALTIKIGVHSGPALAVGANGILDYFGHTVNVAARIQQESDGGDIVLTDHLAERYEPLLAHCRQERFSTTLRGTRDALPLRRLLPGA